MRVPSVNKIAASCTHGSLFWRGTSHDCHCEAAPGTLPLRLLPQCALLAECESARPEQRGETLARRRRALDTELQRFASGSEPRSRGTPEERLRLEDLGGQVVEGDHAARGTACDRAQGGLDGFPVQEHRHALP